MLSRHFASDRGYIEIAKELVNHGTDVNGSADTGSTPSTLAAQMGHKKIVKFCQMSTLI